MAFLDFIVMLFGVLLGVAFFTLFERKILGYIHFRKGPTKVFYFGILQPISDAVKLFSKEILKGSSISFFLYLVGPLLGIFILFTLWKTFLSFFGVYGSLFSLLYIFCFMSLGVYFLFFCSWSSNSKYSLFGGYRSISQSISYEVSMIFFVFVFVFLIGLYDISFFYFFQLGFWFFLVGIIFLFGWFYMIFAESNRTPFDFSEGESELVSGFNVEYGGGIFSLIFITEYGMIIFLSFISVVFFFGSSFFLLKLMFICFFFVLVRCCYPRYRYDLLMESAWKIFIPLSLGVLLLTTVFIFKSSSIDSFWCFQSMFY